MQLYKISFTTTPKIYIGITNKTIQKRLVAHIKKSRTGSTLAIHNAIRKHGNPIINVISECDDWELLCLAEQEAIEKFNTKVPNGYNIASGGSGTVGVKMSESEKVVKSKLMKDTVSRPEIKSLISKNTTARNKTKEARQISREVCIKRNSDPNVKKQASKIMTKLNANPDFKKKSSERMKALNSDPVFAKARNERSRKLCSDPIYKENLISRNNIMNADPIHKMKVLIGHAKRCKRPFSYVKEWGNC
jgi:group I intron endonuclease